VTLDLLKIHETEPNFLPRFISYFDGEKDPRNLMIIFGILNVVMTEWDASSCVQVGSLFDIANSSLIVCRICLMLRLTTSLSHLGRRRMIHTRLQHKI
jgi:hypothetical protein